jgi:hypothetical protein
MKGGAGGQLYGKFSLIDLAGKYEMCAIAIPKTWALGRGEGWAEPLKDEMQHMKRKQEEIFSHVCPSIKSRTRGLFRASLSP